MIIKWDCPHGIMWEYVGDWEWCHYDEAKDIYVDVDGEPIDTSKWICDWYEIWWRWRNYFKLKKWKSRLDWPSPFDKPGEVLADCAASCYRWDVDLRRMWDRSPFAYINDEWEYIKCPEVFEEEFKTDAEHWKQWWWGYYDTAKYDIANRKYKHEFHKWFKAIPKDEVVTLIDYHD